MSLPVAKLIDKTIKTYSYYFCNKEYGFRQGATQSVPVALALRLKEKINSKGKHMFDVTSLPEIIKNDGEIRQCLLFND